MKNIYFFVIKELNVELPLLYCWPPRTLISHKNNYQFYVGFFGNFWPTKYQHECVNTCQLQWITFFTTTTTTIIINFYEKKHAYKLWHIIKYKKVYKYKKIYI